MPPRFAAFRSRTNSILDTITGAIPDSPTSGTFKDRSLTCRRCGNRFRDAAELDLHFNLLPDHSDYGDSHDYDSFVRAKTSRKKSKDPGTPLTNRSSVSLTSPLESPSQSGFSDSSAYYQPKSPTMETQDKPNFFRKLSTLTSTPLVPTEQGESSGPESPSKSKGKARARAFPSLGRDDTGFAQVLGSDDGHTVTHASPDQPSTSYFEPELADANSIKSDSSFRTAASYEKPSEKSQLAASYARMDSKANKIERDTEASEPPPFRAPRPARIESDTAVPPPPRAMRPARARARHASDGDLLITAPHTILESSPPPSYQELHGNTDPFSNHAAPVPPRPWLHSRTRSVANPSTNAAWPSTGFPVSFQNDDLSNDMASSSISQPRPWLSTSSFPSSTVSSPPQTPSSAKSPSGTYASFPLPLSPVSPTSSSQARSRHSSRTRSESNPASTRCPTCFAKYSSLASVLKHLDTSECGAVEFESGIV